VLLAEILVSIAIDFSDNDGRSQGFEDFSDDLVLRSEVLAVSTPYCFCEMRGCPLTNQKEKKTLLPWCIEFDESGL